MYNSPPRLTGASRRWIPGFVPGSISRGKWKFSHLFAIAAVGLLLIQPAQAQLRVADQNPWRAMERLPEDRPAAANWIRAPKHKATDLDHVKLRRVLDAAPSEKNFAGGAAAAEISLPMPDGSSARFRFVESPVMAPELAAKFPEIRTYMGQGIDDPAATVRFDVTPAGFHAQILSPRGAVYIDPAFRGDNRLHTSYYKRDYRRAQDGFKCFVEENLANRSDAGGTGLNAFAPLELARSGGNLRTYRLACAANGEYTAFHGGTVASGLAAIVTAVNRVTGVYEAELAIRLVLVGNNNLIVYTNSATDPYSLGAGGDPSPLLTQNQSTLDTVIGSANYDIGHVFSTAGGGLAGLGVVCVSGQKARGETGMTTPVGDAFYIDYVAHEMGHQFGGNHTFNSSTDNCGGGNRNASTAYERGSGSTIMAYAGICGADDLQPNSDPYFHSVSFDEMLTFSTAGSGNSCAVITSTGNTAPTVSAGANYTIPKGTPFTLTASGSDPNGDALTYCWEERDLGVTTTVSAADNGTSPLFRSWNPTTSPARIFPRLQDLLNNTLAVGEILPNTTRTMNFRVTARDNRAGGGGVSTADMQVSVTAAAGPFQVTSHNSGGTFSGLQTVTWSVAGTTNAPVSAANVNILLSTNGGQSFPITLLAGTPNDGSQLVAFPNITNATARLRVEAAGNIFFDLCNSNFNIVPTPSPTPLISLESAVLVAETCAATNNAVDPGETVTVDFSLRNTGSGDTTNLVATLLLTNGVVAASPPQNFGVLVASGAAVSHSFSLTATGACGGSFAAVFQLQDGASNLGTVSQNFSLGAIVTTTVSQTNAAAIAVPASTTKGKASIYPSTVSVAGVTGSVSKITVTLKGLNHTYPDDLDILLVGPTGQNVMLMSDTGAGDDLVNGQLTFDDAAINFLPDASAISSGTYRPTSFETSTDNLAAPAPSAPFGTNLAGFNGSDPNGTWSLYLFDDANTDTGSLAQGWELNVTTFNVSCCVSNPAMSDLVLQQSVTPTPLNVGSNLTFTLSVTNLGPDAANSVIVTSALPAGVSFVTANVTQGSWTNSGNDVTGLLGSLANGASASITIEATTVAAGSWTNAAGVSGNTIDPVPANNLVPSAFIINSPPSISAISDVTTNEDSVIGPLVFMIGDAETPATALSLAVASSDTNLVALAGLALSGTGSNRSLTITPVANQSGVATISVTVGDGLATMSTVFLLTINAVNDVPGFTSPAAYAIVEGGTLIFTNTANDVEAPPQILAFSLLSAPTNAAINPATGVFTWTPEEAQGPETNSFWVIVTDDGVPGMSATQLLTVVVVESNMPPALAAISDVTMVEGQSLGFTNFASDDDLPANALTFSLENAPTNAAINPTNGVFTWATDESQGPGTNVISVIVTDDGVPSLTATQSFTVVVLETNGAPALVPISDFTIAEGFALSFTNVASDPDNGLNTLTFSLENAPIGATVDATNGVFNWTPDESAGGTTNLISVTVTDDGVPSLSATQSFTVIVLETNTAPVLDAIGDVTIAEGDLLSFTNFASDADSPANILVFTLGNAPTNAAINPTNGVFTWTPDESQGPFTNLLSVIVTDDGTPSFSTTQSFTVIVLETNAPPALAAVPDQVVVEGVMFVITNLASDPDLPANLLSFSLESAPANATINATNGLLAWTPDESDGGSTNLFTVILSDDGVPSLTATQSFTVVVLETNDAPVLAGISNYTLVEGEALTFTNLVTDTDTPPNLFTFSLLNAPANALLDATNGIFHWLTGETDGPGSNFISVVVTDDGVPNLSVTQSFTVIVLETNLAPVLAGISNFTIFESETLTFTNLATDADLPVNQLTFSLENAPTNAVLNPTTGTFQWTPGEAQGPGSNFISIVVTDDGAPGLSVTQSFTVIVVETNLAPTLVGIPDHKIHAGMTLSVTNVASDPDVPSNNLVFSLEPGAPFGAAVGGGDGVFHWMTSDADANTVQSITVRVDDDGVPPLWAAQTFLVTVVSRPVITGIELTNDVVQVSWTALTGQLYRLQTKTNLDAANWSDVLPDITAAGPTASQTNAVTPEAMQLYRVMVVP